MFLHSGAGLHGHEYSQRQPNAPQNAIHRRSPLLRHSLVHPVSRSATMPVDSSNNSTASGSTSTSASHSISTISRSSFSSSPRPSSVRPARPLSEYASRTEQVVRFKEPDNDPTPVPAYRATKPERSLSVSFSPVVSMHPPPRPAQSPQPMSSLQQQQQPEPQPSQQGQPQHRKSDIISEDDGGFSASELSDASQANGISGRKKKRRQPRQSTAFLIAHPAPRQNAKPRLIQVRPKLLMQLQQLARDRRPRPSLDVFPSSIVAGSGIANRLSQRFPRVFRLRSDLGVHDVLVVKSENYEPDSDDDDSDDDEENIGKRELTAVLSPIAREDRTEIVLADGSVWVATPLPNGSFEFLHREPGTGHLTTARWVRRTTSKPLPTGAGHGPCPSPGPSPSPVPGAESRFTFSIINPLSRRHPIMASLTSNYLDILESYTTLSPSSGRYPPTINNRSFTPGPTEDDDSGVGIPERTTQAVDESMKVLISVTAIWVALRQGWSPYYKAPVRPPALNTSDAVLPSAQAPTTPTTPSTRGRSHSTIHDSHAGRMTPEPTSASTGVSLKDRFRHRGPRDHSPGAVSLTGGLPRRATSTGAAFIQRRAQRQSSLPVSDASDTERANAAAPRRRRILSGEWNIPRRGGQRARSPLRQPHDGGVRLDMHDSPYSGRKSAEPARSVPQDGGVSLENHPGLSSAASARLARQRERRSMPVPSRVGAATPGSEKTRSLYGPDDGGALVDSPENLDDAQSGYFDQDHDDHDEHGGVPVGPGTASLYVEFEDKKRGKWKSLTSWLRKFGSR